MGGWLVSLSLAYASAAVAAEDKTQMEPRKRISSPRGYTVIGKLPGVSLRNQWYADAGIGYYWTKRLVTSVYYDGGGAWWAGSKILKISS